ncbi:MAG: hypothetical protein ACP5T3_02460 [Candidatus Micrarchaeia archaeon]
MLIGADYLVALPFAAMAILLLFVVAHGILYAVANSESCAARYLALFKYSQSIASSVANMNPGQASQVVKHADTSSITAELLPYGSISACSALAVCRIIPVHTQLRILVVDYAHTNQS